MLNICFITVISLTSFNNLCNSKMQKMNYFCNHKASNTIILSYKLFKVNRFFKG